MDLNNRHSYSYLLSAAGKRSGRRIRKLVNVLPDWRHAVKGYSRLQQNNRNFEPRHGHVLHSVPTVPTLSARHPAGPYCLEAASLLIQLLEGDTLNTGEAPEGKRLKGPGWHMCDAETTHPTSMAFMSSPALGRDLILEVVLGASEVSGLKLITTQHPILELTILEAPQHSKYCACWVPNPFDDEDVARPATAATDVPVHQGVDDPSTLITLKPQM